jgi:hypothetical protein
MTLQMFDLRQLPVSSTGMRYPFTSRSSVADSAVARL